MGQQFSPQRGYVQLDYFNINNLNDTLISGSPFDDLYVYGVDFSFQNLSFVKVNLTSIYTSDFQIGSPFYITYDQQIMEQVAPVQNLEIDTTMVVILQHPNEVRAVIPGIDYRFNNYSDPVDANVATSIEELSYSEAINVVPNPFTDLISIDITEAITYATIYDANGRVIKHVADPQNESINLEYLAQGIYFLRVKTSEETYMTKIVKDYCL